VKRAFQFDRHHGAYLFRAAISPAIYLLFILCKSIFRLKSKIWILADKKLLNIKWGAAFDLPSAKYELLKAD